MSPSSRLCLRIELSRPRSSDPIDLSPLSRFQWATVAVRAPSSSFPHISLPRDDGASRRGERIIREQIFFKERVKGR
eukprot:scaffold316525_cov26-Tisochrysis_lutea.AAC.1